MRYMLDTNIVSDIIRHPQGSAAQRARKEARSICVSIIVAAELRYGCAKRQSEALTQRVEAFLGQVEVLPFDVPADTDYGAIRAHLETTGHLIGSNDLLIAAHAASIGAALVTGNEREFRRVADLPVENWLF